MGGARAVGAPGGAVGDGDGGSGGGDGGVMEIAAVAVGVAGAVRRGWAGMGAWMGRHGFICYMLYVICYIDVICYMFTKDEQRKALPSPLHGDSLQLSGTRLNQTNGKLLHSCRVKVGRHLQSSCLMLALSHRTVVKPP